MSAKNHRMSVGFYATNEKAVFRDLQAKANMTRITVVELELSRDCPAYSGDLGFCSIMS